MEVIDLTKHVMKAIPGYEGLYSATSDGKIYRHGRKHVKTGWVKIRTNTEYEQIPLHRPGLPRTWVYVHQLVAKTFIPNPDNKPQVNHKNCNKHDNRVFNLEWVTHAENCKHAMEHGRYKGTVLSEDQKMELFRLYKSGRYTQAELASTFGIGKSTVYRHLKRMQQEQLVQVPEQEAA